MKPPARTRRAGGPERVLDQTQLIIVRWTALPGINLGNSPLIDAEIGRDIVLHMPEGKAATDLADSLISQFCAETFRWSHSHTLPFRCTTSLDGHPELWNQALSSGIYPVARSGLEPRATRPKIGKPDAPTSGFLHFSGLSTCGIHAPRSESNVIRG